MTKEQRLAFIARLTGVPLEKLQEGITEADVKDLECTPCYDLIAKGNGR